MALNILHHDYAVIPALSFITDASNFINLNSPVDLEISYTIVEVTVWVYINVLIIVYL